MSQGTEKVAKKIVKRILKNENLDYINWQVYALICYADYEKKHKHNLHSEETEKVTKIFGEEAANNPNEVCKYLASLLNDELQKTHTIWETYKIAEALKGLKHWGGKIVIKEDSENEENIRFVKQLSKDLSYSSGDIDLFKSLSLLAKILEK